MISELCIFDLATGEARVVLRHEGHIEAPNWAPDGRALVVNGGGRLYRVDLDRPALDPIDTGPLRQLNNDHGFSPDGRWLAVSDKTETDASCIYVLPAEGGTPRRVTRRVPSWWHGWSPDGRRLIYAGVRREGGPVSVLTCDVESGEETLVTDAFDHCDGPEMTRDGCWIWFNGERAGRVDLWRVRPDGTGLERMTTGETVDWFPHPSPDGNWVVFLAYPPGTEGHPPDLPVSLMILPADGGTPRPLIRFRGGQGTINVPPWAPDSRRFAFMRYPEVASGS